MELNHTLSGKLHSNQSVTWDYSQIYELIGHDGQVHYRRPKGHPMIQEALDVGYTIRLVTKRRFSDEV